MKEVREAKQNAEPPTVTSQRTPVANCLLPSLCVCVCMCVCVHVYVCMTAPILSCSTRELGVAYMGSWLLLVGS